jgi:hypothetical protein
VRLLIAAATRSACAPSAGVVDAGVKRTFAVHGSQRRQSKIPIKYFASDVDLSNKQISPSVAPRRRNLEIAKRANDVAPA